MIDLYSYEVLKLEDIADYERAKKDVVYPHGCSTLQISAAKGQIGYLETPSKVHEKNVVITPSAGINPKYFNVVLQYGIDKFMEKYATGLNIQEKEVGKFEIFLHDPETQNKVVEFVNILDEQARTEEEEIETLSMLKCKLVSQMFV